MLREEVGAHVGITICETSPSGSCCGDGGRRTPKRSGRHVVLTVADFARQFGCVGVSWSVLPWKSCHGSLVLPSLLCLSCPRCPVPTDFSFLSSSGCPALAVLSCPAWPVLSHLFCLSFSACPGSAFPCSAWPALCSVLGSCFACPALTVLFCLSCLAYPVLAVPFWLSCFGCPVLPVLFCLSCSARLVLAVSFWLFCY